MADAVKSTISTFQQPSYYNDPIAQADSSNWAPPQNFLPDPYIQQQDMSNWAPQPTYAPPPQYAPDPYVQQQDESNWAPQPMWPGQQNYGSPSQVMPVFEAPPIAQPNAAEFMAQQDAVNFDYPGLDRMFQQTVQQDISNWDIPGLDAQSRLNEQQDMSNWYTPPLNPYDVNPNTGLQNFAPGSGNGVGAGLSWAMQPFDAIAETASDYVPRVFESARVALPYNLLDEYAPIGRILPDLPTSRDAERGTWQNAQAAWDARSPASFIGGQAEDFRERPWAEQLAAGALFDPLNFLPVVGYGSDIFRGSRYADDVARGVADALPAPSAFSPAPMAAMRSPVMDEIDPVAARILGIGDQTAPAPRMAGELTAVDDVARNDAAFRRSQLADVGPDDLQRELYDVRSQLATADNTVRPALMERETDLASQLRTLTTDLQPSVGATDDYGAGVPFFRGTPDPAQKLTEAMNAFTPGEAPSTGLLRQYDGAVKVAGLEMVEDWENGVKALQKLGIARRSAGQVTVKRTPDMEALFKALHGEGPVPAHLQSVYDDIKRLVDLEAKATEEFDPNFIMREDYFYRGWRAPKETNAGAGGVGAKPGYAKPRTEATFSELLDSGWEPVSWNPYDMLALRRMAGVQFREQKAMVQRMIDLGVATKVDGPVPDGYRIPRIGPAFEGKPFAYTDTAKPADAATRLADEGGAARLGFTDRYAVPDGVANVLEEMFGRRAGDWRIGQFNVSKAWRGSTGGLKRLKLIGSLFQQVDFTTRQNFATFGGVIDDVLHGKPLSAIKKTVMVPADIGKLAWANTRAGRRADLRRQILSDKPIIAGRPGLTLKTIAGQGWTTQDITILNRNTVREMTENALKEPPEGWKGGMTLPLRKAQQIDRAMQNGLFDGVYPQAQITALKNFVVPRLVRQHPDWSDARIAASAATEINKMFSTLGAWQTVFKSAPPGFKDFLRGILFSTNETEALLRQAFSTVSGPNKQMWITYYAGGAVFLGLVANAVHYAATGEHLPLDRYQPLEKDEKKPLGYRYNSQFLAPEMPGITGRGGFPVDLDLMGQMDTIFRMLDPIAFFDARFSVPLRAGLNQYFGEDFFGRKLDTPQERIGQLASDLGMPIGAGQALGAAGLGIEGEQRLGEKAQLLQAGGLNLRARSNADLRDAAAKEKYGEKATWDSLEPYQRNDLMKANPALKEELDTRRDDAIRNDQEWAIDAEQSVQIREDRLADEAEAVRLYAENGDAKAFREMVSNIQSEAAARSKQARIAAGWDPKAPTNPNEAALSAYYDAFDTARLPGGGVDFDVLDRELARLGMSWTPEQKAYIDRNTGLAEHHPGVQELYDAREQIRKSGYWELRDTAWTELNSMAAAPGYQPGMSYDEYKEMVIQEAIAAGVPSYDAEEIAMARHPVLKKFNDAYKERYLYPWADQHPEETKLLVEWDYLNPDAKLEKYLEYLGYR